MGKSDPYVYNAYIKIINTMKFFKKPESVAFFGFEKESEFTSLFNIKNKFFYDKKICNWEINTFPYNIDQKFDLIICTRCAYFSKEL